MKIQKSYNKFLQVANYWEQELGKYTLGELHKQPNEESWSLGQVYTHLIKTALNFQFPCIDKCLKSSENKEKSKAFPGFMALTIFNGFPPIKIKVPPSDEFTPKQPESIEEIKFELQTVKDKMKEYILLLQQNKNQGKVAHPAFSFLNGNEWYALNEMHFNHHIRQKKRIDQFLRKSYYFD